MRPCLRLGAAVLVCTAASSASANGRFPEALRLLESPKNPDHLVVGGTFGLLMTDDRGQNWYHVCENAFALGLREGDPLLEITGDDTLLSGIATSANVSDDCGCTWKAALQGGDTQEVRDLSVDGTRPDSVLAIWQDLASTPHTLRLHESTDRGHTWQTVSDLPKNVVLLYTVDIAPSDPMRVYVTASARPPDGGRERGVLFVSKDRGRTWEELLIPGTDSSAAPYIAAVHPKNADTIFVRTDEWRDVDPSANDALLMTSDGGKTWKEVIRKGAKMFGFALSPDASTVLVGLGDPRQAARSLELADCGLYKASTKDLVFDKIFGGMVSCLRWTSNGLYVCNAQYNPDLEPSDFEIGHAPNADFTLATPNPLTVLLDLKKVRGPMNCLAATCGNSWSKGTDSVPPVCEQFRASCTPLGGSLSCGTDGGGPSIVDGGKRADGGGAGGTNTGSGGAGGADGGDCGCRLPSPKNATWIPFALLGAAAAGARLRRSPRRGS